MRPTTFLLTLAMGLWFAGSTQAQEVVTQAQIDAAPECKKQGRDLEVGDSLLCGCKKNGFDFFVYGTGPYAGHSDICTAARHAGLVTKADGGAVIVIARGRQKTFSEGSANGIKARRWGGFSSSYDLVPARAAGGAVAEELANCAAFDANAAPYDCNCPANGKKGSVWGSGPYTADSHVCTAARHAGAVDETGGPVTLSAAAGQASYEGSAANSVTTSNWGSYGQSFVVAPLLIQAEVDTCGTLDKSQTAYQCSCPEGIGNAGSVWGVGPYTGDSDICSAARHSGAISNAGGVIEITVLGGLDSYGGSEANGVTTRSWGSYGSSFMPSPVRVSAPEPAEICNVMPGDADRYTCSCPAAQGNTGSVWGSGPYTADSDICTAARHSGAVMEKGGSVTVMRMPGLARYRGSAANGAKSADWDSFDSSITFDMN